MTNTISVNYHQAQAIAARATRLRELAKQSRGYGIKGTERIVLTYESPYNHPDARGGLYMLVEGRPGAIPLFAKDLGYERDFALERLGMRDEYGHIQHPDMDGIGFDEFDMGPQLRSLGWLSTTVEFESDAPEELREKYFDSGDPHCLEWTPSRPNGDGWLMAAIYDTEDGPVALYVRRAPDPFAGNVSGEADALAAHAIEELHQLGYTVRDGRLIPPDNLGDLARIAGVLAGDGTGEALQPLPDSAYASDAKPIPDGAQLPEAVEACIACLGDDAAQIRNELANCRPNGEGFIAEEWADNMEEAARLLQAAYGVSVVSPAADPQRNEGGA